MVRKSRKNPVDSTEKIKFKVYKTAIYARLSAENHNGEKIENQIEEIRNYMKNRRIFEFIDIYFDNGYSGTNFQRPEFEPLMEYIRNQKVDYIIVRDLSRFAREHIGAEDYLNNIFSYKNEKFHKISERQRKNMMVYRKIRIKILYSVVNVRRKFPSAFSVDIGILFLIVNDAEMVSFQVGKI